MAHALTEALNCSKIKAVLAGATDAVKQFAHVVNTALFAGWGARGQLPPLYIHFNEKMT